MTQAKNGRGNDKGRPPRKVFLGEPIKTSDGTWEVKIRSKGDKFLWLGQGPSAEEAIADARSDLRKLGWSVAREPPEGVLYEASQE